MIDRLKMSQKFKFSLDKKGKFMYNENQYIVSKKYRITIKGANVCRRILND